MLKIFERGLKSNETFCYQRLQFLDAKWRLHDLLNGPMVCPNHNHHCFCGFMIFRLILWFLILNRMKLRAETNIFRRKKLNKSAHIVTSTIAEKLTPTFTPPHVWIRNICLNTSRRLLIQKEIWKYARKTEKKWLWTKFLKGTK